MAQKGSKKRDIAIDEEKDAFLSFINKKSRNPNKKLNEIKELEKKDKDSLKPEQIEKIKSKSDCIESIKYFETIKNLYYEALKAAKDEGKTESVERKTEETTEVIKSTAEPVVQVTVVDQETSLKVLNLVHLAQFSSDERKREELKSKSIIDGNDFETVYEFYSKIFTFSESDKFDKVGTKLTNSNSELESYLNKAEKIALRNKTYKYLFETVERVTSSDVFRNLNADISPARINASNISAIGSELRHEKAQVEEPKVHEAKVESPVKNVEKEIITVEQLEKQQEAQRQLQQQHQNTQQHHHHQQHHTQHHHHHGQKNQQKSPEKGEQKDWAEIADDDKQEEVKRDETNEEDDGFVEVKKRTAAKNTQGNRGSRGGNRGGQRGGFKNGSGRPQTQGDGEKREYKPREQREPREGGNREGGNRDGYKREGGNRDPNRPRGPRSNGENKQYVPKTSEKPNTQASNENKEL